MSDIALRIPSKYATSTSPASSPPAPPLHWLLRTWTVTDSTLAMWRKARNVRITYTSLPRSSSSFSSGAARIDDLVEYEALDGKGGVKSVAGIDTASIPPIAAAAAAAEANENKKTAEEEESEPEQQRIGEWNWRGKSWLFFVSSHWEVLAWGETKLPTTTVAGEEGEGGGEQDVTERWVVTWFAPTMFTKEGVDFYSDRREGLSEGTRERLMDAFKEVQGGPMAEVAEMVAKDMRGVKVELPWLGGK